MNAIPMSGITVVAIQEATAAVFGVTVTEMRSACRARAVARPRQAAMFLARQLTARSLPEIGRAFGGRDHTTVMHAVQRIADLVERDPELAIMVGWARTKAGAWSTENEVDHLRDLLAQRNAEIAKLQETVKAREGEIAMLMSKRPSPRQAHIRACLKCHRPIVSEYPGLCKTCRHENEAISPLAEGSIG